MIFCGEEQYKSQPGDFVFVPKGLTHNYQVGPEGGRVLVWEQEDEIARRYGQEFLDKLKHCGQ